MLPFLKSYSCECQYLQCLFKEQRIAIVVWQLVTQMWECGLKQKSVQHAHKHMCMLCTKKKDCHLPDIVQQQKIVLNEKVSSLAVVTLWPELFLYVLGPQYLYVQIYMLCIYIWALLEIFLSAIVVVLNYYFKCSGIQK